MPYTPMQLVKTSVPLRSASNVHQWLALYTCPPSLRFKLNLLHCLSLNCLYNYLLQGGICDRAFSPNASMTCKINCSAGLCTSMCEELDQHFPTNSTPQGIHVWSMLHVYVYVLAVSWLVADRMTSTNDD